MWFKGLVSAAAIAIIAGVGVFLWDRHQAEAARIEAAEKAECDLRFRDWSRLKNGLPGEREHQPAVALSMLRSCGYEPTAEDRKAAGMD